MKNRIAILGGRESGAGAAILAARKGYVVWVSEYGSIPDKYKQMLDKEGIAWEEGKHSEEKILNASLVVKSPGIPEKAPIIQKIREKGIKIISEIEFAARHTSAKLIGITGSNGKTTTTLLTYKVLKDAGLKVACVGNVGESFAYAVATGDYDFYVIEVSSFQLDDIETFRPDIAILLNITPDHLDRYEYNISAYAAAKFAITRNQTEADHFIYCLDDPLTLEYIENHPTKARKYGISLDKKENSIAWTQNQIIHVHMEQDNFKYDFEQMRLVGKHNLYNTMAAAVVSRIIDLRKDSIRESFSDFHNVEHRLEKVASVGGIEFINDSKATNVNSAWYALESINKPIVWIVGGVDKGNDYKILIPLVEKKVKSIVALGSDVRKIHQAFGHKVSMIINAQDMAEAVKLSYHLADKGDAVLLSPACASFDLFENYEDRGRQFKGAVKNL